MLTSAPTNAARVLLWLLAMLVAIQSSIASACWCNLSLTGNSQESSSAKVKHDEVAESHSCKCCHQSNSPAIPQESDTTPSNRKPCGCPEGCVCQSDPMPQRSQEASQLRSIETLVTRIAPPQSLKLTVSAEGIRASSMRLISLPTTLQRCSELCRFVV
jgi:hypothetical protein